MEWIRDFPTSFPEDKTSDLPSLVSSECVPLWFLGIIPWWCWPGKLPPAWQLGTRSFSNLHRSASCLSGTVQKSGHCEVFFLFSRWPHSQHLSLPNWHQEQGCLKEWLTSSLDQVGKRSDSTTQHCLRVPAKRYFFLKGLWLASACRTTLTSVNWDSQAPLRSVNKLWRGEWVRLSSLELKTVLLSFASFCSASITAVQLAISRKCLWSSEENRRSSSLQTVTWTRLCAWCVHLVKVFFN